MATGIQSAVITMSQRNLVYYWIAHYANGISLPQFDPYNFKENIFSDIDQNELIGFSLYPFNRNLANGINKNEVSVTSIPFLPEYNLKLDKNKRLIYYRDVFISQEEYHLCTKCNQEFDFNASSEMIESKYPSPICPNCGAYDIFICKKCKKIYQRFEDAQYGMCECGGHLKHDHITSIQHSREKRWIQYIIGYQTIINGKNHKVLLRISESGNSEILGE